MLIPTLSSDYVTMTKVNVLHINKPNSIRIIII